MSVEILLKNFGLTAAPDTSEVSRLCVKADFKLDSDYIDFISSHNGASGILGIQNLILWNIEDVCALNPYYDPVQDKGHSNQFFFIGSNGADAGYAIRKADGVFIEIPFIGMEDEVPNELGIGFKSFLQLLSKSV